MKKILLIAIPLGLVALLLTAYVAQSHVSRRAHGKLAKEFLFYKMDQVSKELKLDATQQARMDTLKQDISAMMDQRRGKREEIHNLVKAEFEKENPDIQKIQPLVDQQIDDMAQSAHQLVARVAEFYTGLNPEQKKAFHELCERMHDEHGFRH